MQRRAFFVAEVKAVDEEQRVIRGIATSPRVDRMGDIIDPAGVKVAPDIPLFMHHDSREVVGRARLGKATKDGIPFEARLPKVAEAGRLRDRVDEAWQMVKYQLITGVSIGFSVLNNAYEQIKDGGYKFLETEVLELSLVPIPAQPDAVIQGFKSLDAGAMALLHKLIAERVATHGASPPGKSPPDASGTQKQPAASGFSFSRKDHAMKTLQELREERTQKSARLNELMELRTAENRRFTDEEGVEFDALSDEVKELDDDIRVKSFQETQAKAATPVQGKSASQAAASRGGFGFVKRQDPDDKFKGQSFVRFQIAKALGMVHGESPITIATERWGKTHPKLVEFMKATVAGGGTGSGEWAAELAALDGRFTGDFIEFLYAKTVFDQLDLREVPARVKVKGQDGAFVGYWVGESKAIPASAGDYSTVDLTPLKVAALSVISMELLEDSSPSAEMLVRDGLVEASAQKVDTTFLSAAALSAGVSPAGILNGVSAITPSGTDLAAVRADLATLLYPFVQNKMATGLTLVMNPATGLALSNMYGSLDQPAFPDINETGGTLNRRRVIVGDNVTPGNILAVRGQDIWKIGDSGIRISMSVEATIEQRDDPTGATDTPTGVTTTGLTNMFQEESVAFKVVRRINFQKRRSTAVTYISDAEYGGVVS